MDNICDCDGNDKITITLSLYFHSVSLLLQNYNMLCWDPRGPPLRNIWGLLMQFFPQARCCTDSWSITPKHQRWFCMGAVRIVHSDMQVNILQNQLSLALLHSTLLN